MNKLAKVVATASVATVLVAAVGLSACGGRKISGTYEKNYDKTYVAENNSQFEGTYFLTMGEATSKNTLEMKDDGTYKYTKDLEAPAFSASFIITYEGTYSDGKTEYEGTAENSYILNKPTSATWSLTPGMFAMAGWGIDAGDDWMTHMGDKFEGALADPVLVAKEDKNVIDAFLGATLIFADTSEVAEADFHVEVALVNNEIIYL